MVSLWQALWSFQNKIRKRLYLLSKWHHTLDSFYHITLCAHDPASGHAFHGCLTCRSRRLYVINMLIADSWAENCFNYIIYDISPIYDPWPMDLFMIPDQWTYLWSLTNGPILRSLTNKLFTIPDQWTYLRSLTNAPIYDPLPMHLFTIPDQWTYLQSLTNALIYDPWPMDQW